MELTAIKKQPADNEEKELIARAPVLQFITKVDIYVLDDTFALVFYNWQNKPHATGMIGKGALIRLLEDAKEGIAMQEKDKKRSEKETQMDKKEENSGKNAQDESASGNENGD